MTFVNRVTIGRKYHAILDMRQKKVVRKNCHLVDAIVGVFTTYPQSIKQHYRAGYAYSLADPRIIQCAYN